MKLQHSLPVWSIAAPVIAWLLIGVNVFVESGNFGVVYTAIQVAGLFASVLAAVFHAGRRVQQAEHQVFQPAGTNRLRP